MARTDEPVVGAFVPVQSWTSLESGHGDARTRPGRRSEREQHKNTHPNLNDHDLIETYYKYRYSSFLAVSSGFCRHWTRRGISRKKEPPATGGSPRPSSPETRAMKTRFDGETCTLLTVCSGCLLSPMSPHCGARTLRGRDQAATPAREHESHQASDSQQAPRVQWPQRLTLTAEGRPAVRPGPSTTQDLSPYVYRGPRRGKSRSSVKSQKCHLL